ncbi:MAG TPA: zf-TFIIB domain-containing protein [Candidatus Limnocylindrales bacterium]|nr:zf-TFIIB domain-containing protein [Candidatus Limnocylindrales bacterium]
MKCPLDGAELLMTTRNGIEIDYCPQCRGIWLDRGELDKLIEREEQELGRRQPAASSTQPARMRETIYRHHDDDDDDDRRDHVYYNNDGKPKKKRSVLGEMFDIFD